MSLDVVAAYIVKSSRVILVEPNNQKIWTPFVASIESGETPEQALTRKLKEELTAEIKFLHPETGRELAVPFCTGKYQISGEEHDCQFYLCTLKDSMIYPRFKEINAYKWFYEKMLDEEGISESVRLQASQALSLAEKIIFGKS